MYYLYLLYSDKMGLYYIGRSANLKSRLKSHNSKRVISTRNGTPWRVIYYEAYQYKCEVIRREKSFEAIWSGFATTKGAVNPINPHFLARYPLAFLTPLCQHVDMVQDYLAIHNSPFTVRLLFTVFHCEWATVNAR